MRLTVKIRLKDKHAADLQRQAEAVNYVWNYCNETQQKAVHDRRPWLSGYDLQRLTAGSSKLLNLNASTIQRICHGYSDARRGQKAAWLRWRGRQSLGWVPVSTGNVTFNGAVFRFYGRDYQPMHLSPHLRAGLEFGAGSFNADARGRWYLNLPVETEAPKPAFSKAVGVDLGLKALATLSTGDKIEVPAFYRKSEAALAVAQRSRKSKRARAIHAKIWNRRKDFLHKASALLVKEYGTIIIGGVRPAGLAKTRMAKSVNDASWAGFKRMLSYKAIMHGGRTIEVNEAYTTQTCSGCGSLPPSRPLGIACLGIREWQCSDCGAVHDRDVNAARNILRLGLETLAEGAARAEQSWIPPMVPDASQIEGK